MQNAGRFIPLAIELAAARIRSLSPEELFARLQDRFRLLRGSGRGTLERHQTLRSTVSWSYQLLSDTERVLFDRVSVFAGGFDLRAAGVVCGTDLFDESDVLDLLSSLVDKSMVLAMHTAGARATDCRKRSPIRRGAARDSRRDDIAASPAHNPLHRAGP